MGGGPPLEAIALETRQYHHRGCCLGDVLALLLLGYLIGVIIRYECEQNVPTYLRQDGFKMIILVFRKRRTFNRWCESCL